MAIPESTSLNLPAPETMRLLLSRRSARTAAMGAPGPSGKEIERILTAAARVPDHGKLAPWRFIVFEGEARARFGRILVALLRRKESLSPEREEQERNRFMSAPLVVAVVSRVRADFPIPEWEQVLSAGASCQNLLLAAHALGYVGCWLTHWYAYDRDVAEALGLAPSERIAGFIHIGTGLEPLRERLRPDLEPIVTRF